MKRTIKIVIIISFVIYVIALGYILFGGVRGYWDEMSVKEYFHHNSSFAPFRTICWYITGIAKDNVNVSTAIENLVGNMILFLPMTFYLPSFFKRCRGWLPIIWRMLLLLIILEIMQVLTKRGSMDIDDVILNMSGALIGFGLWKSKLGQKIYTYAFK